MHTDQMLSKDYKSTTTLTIANPQKHPEYRFQKEQPAGPRGSAMEQRIKEQVEAEFNQKSQEEFDGSRRRTYTTSTGEAHDIPGFRPYL